MGWVEFRICNIDGIKKKNSLNLNEFQDATQECLDKILLKNETGSTRFEVPIDIIQYRKTLMLPQGLTCKQCVIQVSSILNAKYCHY